VSGSPPSGSLARGVLIVYETGDKLLGHPANCVNLAIHSELMNTKGFDYTICRVPRWECKPAFPHLGVRQALINSTVPTPRILTQILTQILI